MWFPHPDSATFTNGSHETMDMALAAHYMGNFEDYLRFERPLEYREILKSLRVNPEEKDPLEWALLPVMFLQEVS